MKTKFPLKMGEDVFAVSWKPKRKKTEDAREEA